MPTANRWNTSPSPARAGWTEIGFSDHCPMPGPEPFDDWRMRRDELPRYVDMVLDAREKAAPFPVRLGLECDFIAGHEDWIEELAGLAPWDYLIGSVHYIAPGWAVDDPQWIGKFTASGTATEEIWTAYWQAYERCIASGLFDFVAHPDLVKKFGHRPPGDLRRFYEPAIAAAAARNVAVEVSTAGLRKPVGELYPAAGFLELATRRAWPWSSIPTPTHPERWGWTSKKPSRPSAQRVTTRRRASSRAIAEWYLWRENAKMRNN